MKWKQEELKCLLRKFHETLHKVTDHSDEIDHATQLKSDKNNPITQLQSDVIDPVTLKLSAVITSTN